MPKKNSIVILIAAAILTLACLCLPLNIQPVETETPPTNEPASVTTDEAAVLPPLELNKHPVDLQNIPACVKQLARLLVLAENVSYDGEELQNEFTIAEYTVSGDEISAPNFPAVPQQNHALELYQEDTGRQQLIWQFVVDVIPLDQRTRVAQFILFTDGVSNTLGSVVQTDEDPSLWQFELDIMDAEHFPDFSSTVIHEFGHVLSLNDSQIVTDMDVFNNPDDEQAYEAGAATCDTYFLSEGCSRPDSYLGLFFERFWPDFYDEWAGIDAIEDDTRYEERLSDFYQEYADQFVSEYAVTSPEEDLAESFMYYIFSPEPARNTISAQKIRFFYEFPELVELRDRILPNLCAYVEMP